MALTLASCGSSGKEIPLMSIAMSLSHVKTTTTTKQVQLPSANDEEDVTEFSFKRSVSYEKVGDNRISHYQKSWEKKEKKVNDASRSSASRIRQLALQPPQLSDMEKIEQELNQLEKSNTGFDLLSAESKWTEVLEKEAAKKAKDADDGSEAGSWTMTAKKSIEYSRG